MKIVIQRVNSAKLTVDNNLVSQIQNGLVVYVGFNQNDTNKHFDWFVNKVVGMRIFRDENDKMNLSVKDIGGKIMVVSNFSLYADCSHGFRPSFINAMESSKAKILYEEILEKFKNAYQGNVFAGLFGEHMIIDQVNDGPINIVLEESEFFKDWKMQN